MDCPNCTGGFNKVTVVMGDGLCVINEWCDKCRGNGHIPAITTLKQFCNSPKVEE